MSTSEIIAELPKLNHEERRRVAKRIFELEDEGQILADTDRRADANFLLLDAMESEDASRKSG
jgi:mRNA-degrading endonuclease RelE of RelBE toxin-antitoxin system